MIEFLLFAGNSATGTVKAAFLQLFYFTAFRYLYNCYVMTNDELKIISLIFSNSIVTIDRVSLVIQNSL